MFLLGIISVLFWLWIFIKGIISRKIKLPYVWGLYFSIIYIFFFSKRIITDRATGRSWGFGFVEMSDGAEAAIEALNGTEVDGRELVVNESRPKDKS